MTSPRPQMTTRAHHHPWSTSTGGGLLLLLLLYIFIFIYIYISISLTRYPRSGTKTLAVSGKSQQELMQLEAGNWPCSRHPCSSCGPHSPGTREEAERCVWLGGGMARARSSANRHSFPKWFQGISSSLCIHAFKAFGPHLTSDNHAPPL